MNSDVPDMLQAPDIGSDLIWPDSETLFQTIMSMDTANQWQMPLGTLPFLPGVQQAGSDICDNQSNNFKSPDSFDDRGPAISAIPSGGSHRAVHDVSKMVSNLVCPRISPAPFLISNKRLVFKCNSGNRSYFYHFCFPRRMSPYVFRPFHPNVPCLAPCNICIPREYAAIIAQCYGDWVLIPRPQRFDCEGKRELYGPVTLTANNK